MNFKENDLWKEKAELLDLRLSKLARSKGLLKLEFDTKDQVLFWSFLCNSGRKYGFKINFYQLNGNIFL